MKAIFSRRSIRKFEERPVERDKLELILRAAMQSPTAKNTQCWEFLVVTDKEAREAVSKMSPFAVCAANAPAVIIPVVNLKRVHSSDAWWVEDLSAATQTMLLQIEKMGLGGVWLGMYPNPERTGHISGYFNLPEHIIPFAAVPVGYKLREKEPEDRFDPAKVHWEKF